MGDSRLHAGRGDFGNLSDAPGRPHHDLLDPECRLDLYHHVPATDLHPLLEKLMVILLQTGLRSER